MTTVLEFNANEIIKDALEDTGIIPPGQNSPPALQDKCLRIMNRLLKEWQTGPNRLWLESEGVVFINPGQESYLLGPSGDFSCAATDLITNALKTLAASGALTIEVESTEGLTEALNLIPFDPIDEDRWTSINGAVISTEVGVDGVTDLVVTNAFPLGSSASLPIDLDTDINDFIIGANNTSGDGEEVKFLVQDPNTVAIGRVLLGTGDNVFGQLGTGDTTPRYAFVQEDQLIEDWAQQPSAGAEHAAGIRQDGTLWSTGSNAFGQLGLGPSTKDQSDLYVQEKSGSTDWVACQAGFNFTVAIKEIDGVRTLWAVGFNDRGQLGVGDLSDRDVFTQEATLTEGWDLAAASGLGQFAMAIQEVAGNRTLWGVGDNGKGELGLNTGTNQVDFVPETLSGVSAWSQQATGKFHTMAIDGDGKLWASGDNSDGQFGNGTNTSSTKFVQVGTDTNYDFVACGDYFTYVIKDGLVFSTGLNDKGQLALGDTRPRNIFEAAVNDVDDFLSSSSGTGFAAVVKTDGTLWVTGRNTQGQLGLGDLVNRDEYTQVGTATNWVSVSCGDDHLAATNALKQLWSAGDNTYGQIGLNNTTTPQSTLIRESLSGTNFNEPTCGDGFTITRIQGGDDELKICGRNDKGQLGDNTFTDRDQFATLSTVTNGLDIKEVVAGASHAMVTSTDGHLFGTGNNDNNQLGLGPTSGNLNNFTKAYLPVNNTLIDFSMSLDGDFTALIKEDGTLWAAGANNRGQLGLSFTSTEPVIEYRQEANKFTNWVKVTCGADHMLAIRSDGTMWGTGLNSSGQLGRNNVISLNQLLQVGTDSDWAEARAGDSTSLAKKTNGSLLGCGVALGRAQYDDTVGNLVFVPEHEQASNILSAACGGSGGAGFVMFIKRDGTLWGMGHNDEGQLGLGSTPDEVLFAQQIGTGTDWVAVDCGEDFTIAKKINGSLWGSGNNLKGQLGLPQATNQTSIFIREASTQTWDFFACGASHTMAARTNGDLYATGNNNSGQLGVESGGSEVYGFIGTFGGGVGVIFNVLAVACGDQFTTAIHESSTLWSTGNNKDGQLGIDSTDHSDTFVKEQNGYDDWEGLACGSNHALGTRPGGNVYAVGSNANGQLGLGNTTDAHVYAHATSAPDSSGITCGGNSSYLWTGGHTSYSCGLDNTAQLGFGSTGSDQLTFKLNQAEVPNQAFASSGFSGYVDERDKTIHFVGSNSTGQLGRGTLGGIGTTYQPVGADINNATGMGVGEDFTMILRADNTIWGVGVNGSGQQGNPIFSGSSTLFVIESTQATSWHQVECGSAFTMARTTGGELYGTGNNLSGQLGVGDTTNRDSFSRDVLGTSNSVKIACGQKHTTHVNSDRNLFSTGLNDDGQLSLGDGSALTVTKFTQEESGLSVWVDCRGGLNSAMATTINGGLLVAGDNTQDIMGTGAAIKYFEYTTTFLADPGASSVGAGDGFTMVLMEDGTIFGVGANSQNQLGTEIVSELLVQESTKLSNWTAIACGQAFSVVLNENKELFSVGDNAFGQLGVTIIIVKSFIQESTLSKQWISISPGSDFSTARQEDNRLSATGNNALGQLGIAHIASSTNIYTGVHPQLAADSIACGAQHAVAITSGSVTSVGRNNEGQLGIASNSTEETRFQPVVPGFATWVSIAAGGNTSAAKSGDSKLWLTGSNNKGQLGIDSLVNVKQFTQEANGLGTWGVFAVGAEHTVGLAAGKLYGTGSNEFGQIALPDDAAQVQTFTQERSEAPNWAAAKCGDDHTMGTKTDGTLWSTGKNEQGQLGQNDLVDRFTFVKVGTVITWELIACGADFSVVLRSTDVMYVCGDNSKGQLGLGGKSVTDLYQQEFTQGTDWADVDCGITDSMALTIDGTLYGTGRNNHGQLGIGDTTHKTVFTEAFSSDDTWVSVSIAGKHTVAINDDGWLLSTGHNNEGQLGIGNKIDQPIFTREATIGTSWKTASAGHKFTVAIDDNGNLFGTGLNDKGQLGTGEPTSPFTVLTQEVLEDIDWDEVSAGDEFTLASKIDNTFKVITSATTSVDGEVLLPFSRENLTEIIFVIKVEEDIVGSSASINRLSLRDPTAKGDFIGIQQDDDTRHWTTIVEILSDTTLTIEDPLTDNAAEGSIVYSFTDLIDRPLQLYNGRRKIVSASGNDAEIRVEDWSKEEYMNQAIKYSLGPTSRMYYNPTLTDGTLYTWQTGTTVNQQLLFSYNQPFEVVANQTDIPQIPAEWAMALKWGIAQQLITGHGIDQAMAAQINQNAVKSLKDAQSDWSPYAMQLNPLGRR